jgi:pimeloyl-ACP methyl ester carboxylesterase
LSKGYQHIERVPHEVLDAFWRPALGTRQAARAFGRLLASINSDDDLAAVRPQLSRLTAPTLIAWGTGDILFNIKGAHRLAGLIPSTTNVTTIAGARLFFPDERANEFIPLLQQHWEALQNSTSS